LFVDAIENDGHGMMGVDMLYPDPSMRFTSLCKNVRACTAPSLLLCVLGAPMHTAAIAAVAAAVSKP
jgi:hypothetical protein